MITVEKYNFLSRSKKGKLLFYENPLPAPKENLLICSSDSVLDEGRRLFKVVHHQMRPFFLPRTATCIIGLA